MSKKKKENQISPKKDKPTVSPELEGFNVEIDSFGELKTSYDIDKINEFLNKNVEDKKLIDRDDYDKLKSEGNATDEK